MIAHWDEIEGIRLDRGPMGLVRIDLGEAAGTVNVGVARLKIDPGRRSSPVHAELDEEEITLPAGEMGAPPHCHSAEEEIFVVLEGGGTLILMPSPQRAQQGAETDVGDLRALCVPGTVASPLVESLRPGVAAPIEPGGFHGCFWVVPREVLDRVGLLDERFEGAFFEDDGLLARLRRAGSPTRLVRTVVVRHVGGLTALKLPDRGRGWYEQNERRFEDKWDFRPAPVGGFRRREGESVWHFSPSCASWPEKSFAEVATLPEGPICGDCRALVSGGP